MEKVDVKKVLLNLGEENAKILLKELVRPLMQQYAEEKFPAVAPVLAPFFDQLEAGGLVLIDKIDGEKG